MPGLPQTDPLTSVAELIELTTALSTERDLGRLLDMILSSARKLAYAEAGRVYTLDPTGRKLCLQVAQNDLVELPTEAVPDATVSLEKTTSVQNVCGYCALTGDLVSIPDVYDCGLDCSDIYAYDQLTGYRSVSVIALPLRSHREVTVGVLELFNHRDNSSDKIKTFPEQMQSLVKAFASQAAVVVDNARLIDENQRLIEILDHTNRELEDENRRLRQQMHKDRKYEIIGDSPAMKRALGLMEKVLDSDATVLLRGETGTGKELFASVLHANSRRKAGPFIAQNCAALPESLLESELFGFKKGAFSGANSDKKGLIEAADGGTLFLDEIGDMPIGLQAKLLRVLQEGEVRPLGGIHSRQVDVRFVAATNAELEKKINEESFREDLYYRLCVFPIDLPPLRDRKEDIPAVLQYFLDKFAKQYEKQISGFSPAALDQLLLYDYPGNIRELRNLLERAVLLCEGGSILPEHLPTQVSVPPQSVNSSPRPSEVASGTTFKEIVQNFEASLLEEKLKAVNWNQSKAAEELQMPRRTLIEKLNKYNIQRPRRHSSVGHG